MYKINKILFPTDFSSVSENAFYHALNWAKIFEADIHIVTVYNPYVPVSEFPLSNPSIVDISKETDIEVKRKLDHFIDRGVKKVGLDISATSSVQISNSILYGVPETSVCSIAENEKYDLIVLGTRGDKHDFIDKILGTVSHHVVEYAVCPVLLIPPTAEYQKISKVIYAADLKATQAYRIWQTYELLKPLNPSFDCVHVKTDGNEVKELYLYELSNYFRMGHPNIPIDFHLVHFDTVQEGVKYTIEHWGGNLLCMYTPHHSIFQQLFGKSKSHSAIDFMELPVLFIKDKY